jgi:DNA-binding transcriptional LysR family regulator
MELMQLEMFVAVVEEGSVHKAADKVCRTQPAVSIALKKLAIEVGSPLFDRKHRFDYKLSPTGEILYSYASRLLALRNETVAALRNLAYLRRGTVWIGANESTSVYLLPKLIQAFHEKYPEIKIELTCGHSEGLLTELQAHRLDLAVLAHLPEDHNVKARIIMRDELVAIVSPRHRLALATKVRIKDLEKESIITEGPPSPLHEKVVDAFRSHETVLNVQVKSATIETVKQMVANDVGIGFVPLMCVEHELARRELIVVPIENLHLERSLWVVWPNSDVQSHAARAFMRVVNSLAEKSEQSPRNDSSRSLPAHVVDLKTRRHELISRSN